MSPLPAVLPAGCAHRRAWPIAKVAALQKFVKSFGSMGGEQRWLRRQHCWDKQAATSRLWASLSGSPLWALSHLLAPAGEGFGVGHTRNTQTKGVWLWGQPQAVSLPADQPGDPPQQVRSGQTLYSP